MEKIRCGNSVFMRGTEEQKEMEENKQRRDSTFEWEERTFASISAAKKFNGLNSTTVEARKLLPKAEKA